MNPTPKVFLLLGLLSLFFSCNGQDPSATSQNPGNGAPKGEIVSGVGKRATVVFQDQQNNFWFGGGEQGVYKYDGKNLFLFTVKDGLCSSNIWGIQEDQLGNLYFDTPEGICKYDGQSFTTLPLADSEASQNEWILNPDDLWFRMGWDKNGPYRYDGTSLYHLAFPKSERADAFYANNPNASYTPYGIYTLYKDRKGTLWFGTASLGVCRFDGVSIDWLYEEQLTITPEGGDFGIRSILEDKEGFFWFCNSRYRFEILPDPPDNAQTNNIPYKKEKGMGYTTEKGEVDYPYFMSIVEDNEGDLWMVTYSDGVWRNDGQQLIHYPIKNGETDALLFSIYKDRQGGLWLGTHNAGVYHWNDGSFQQFKT